MSRPHRLVDRRLAKALLILQSIMIPVAAVLAWLIHDAVAAKSAALGALVYFLASAYFAWQAFKSSGARASRQILSNMYLGLIGKFVIVVVGLILILSSVSPVSMVAVLGGFILVQAMSWIAPFWLARR
ncbi:F0F1 ATP synthase subunit I [Acinetobacter qingfengensis]|uniref:F0F1 ATP synthase subunit I n=1 Tax=Acinetobacter qingfengensis TaxID=1262585 RepID=A0A1E7RD51_9GAMM|nr:ATP synthase subunit I [Acinetobacter qingfengensis]KAA8732127.1 F0F1 ATP synthase subunit I [Acinetobacter qingfengensis]OEY97206.1 F0F1 ATP synthase subunit I [Acinetobacter qingfengensis]